MGSHVIDMIDIVDYQGQSVIIERAGKPKAAMVSLEDLEFIKKKKAQAKKEFFAMSQQFSDAMKQLSRTEKKKLIQEALTAAKNSI